MPWGPPRADDVADVSAAASEAASRLALRRRHGVPPAQAKAVPAPTPPDRRAESCLALVTQPPRPIRLVCRDFNLVAVLVVFAGGGGGRPRSLLVARSACYQLCTGGVATRRGHEVLVAHAPERSRVATLPAAVESHEGPCVRLRG